MDKRLGIILPILVILVIGIGIALYFSKGSILNQTRNTPSSESMPVQNSVAVNENGFLPSSITIKEGEAVVWINQSGEDATVNSDSHPIHNLHRFLNLGQFTSGSSVEATFSEAGTFGYHNHFHPDQRGTVVVK